MSSPHRIYPRIEDGQLYVRIECPETDGCCTIYSDSDQCHCDCEACADGDHDECVNDDLPAQIDCLGAWPCHYEEVPGCGLIAGDWLGNLSLDEIMVGRFPESWPILADVEWDDGTPTLVPWKEPT